MMYYFFHIARRQFGHSIIYICFLLTKSATTSSFVVPIFYHHHKM